ncbi:MAG: polyprenyl synthetase family protein [Bacteroidales bacterium]|nr:polyprenyl synthetase family protein [Bacteroidales bacterium]
MKRISDYALMAEEAIRDAGVGAGTPASLYGPIDYAMEAGGKRLRPVLMLMAADAFGDDPEKALAPAVGIELFHNFTLLHDDVMDNSATRRGRESVMAKWDVNTAILSGDTMLTQATREISKVDDKLLRNVLDRFNAMALEVYEGQRLDMDFEKMENVSPEAYIEMIQKKTGALLGCSAAIGALIGGASDKDAEALYRFGVMLGTAFQIEDDRLDTFGDPAVFGKPIGGDIRNNKQTFLMVSALARNDEDAAALRAVIALEPSDTKVKAATRIYERMEMPAVCTKAVAEYSSAAMTALKKTSLSPEKKEAFKKLVEKLTGRKK